MRGAAAVLSAAVVIHFIHEILFIKWSIQAWHFSFGHPRHPRCPRGAVASVVAGRRGETLGLSALGTMLITGVAGMAFRMAGSGGERWHVVAYDAARWIRASTPAAAVLAMKDAGIVGYFSERRVVNLDGVVNDLELQARFVSAASVLTCGGGPSATWSLPPDRP